MVSRTIIFAVVVIAILVGSGAYYFTSVSGSNSSNNAVTINMLVTSGTPQNGAPDEFLPQNWTVTQGQHVTVVFDNTDDDPHEMVIPAFGFTTGIVPSGSTVRVSFVPDKAGTFPFYQPAGACDYNGEGACTGAQETNGTVTVLPH